RPHPPQPPPLHGPVAQHHGGDAADHQHPLEAAEEAEGPDEQAGLDQQDDDGHGVGHDPGAEPGAGLALEAHAAGGAGVAHAPVRGEDAVAAAVGATAEGGAPHRAEVGPAPLAPTDGGLLVVHGSSEARTVVCSGGSWKRLARMRRYSLHMVSFRSSFSSSHHIRNGTMYERAWRSSSRKMAADRPPAAR